MNVLDKVIKGAVALHRLIRNPQRYSNPIHRIREMITPRGHSGFSLQIGRHRNFAHRRRWLPERVIRCGPNSVHAWIRRADGTVEDLGVSHNLLTNIGRDAWAGAWGFARAGGNGAPSTAVGATSITATGTPWTASNLATPQLGLAGLRVKASPHTTTNNPVYGNIVSNSTSVATIDKWWNPDDTTGTTPTSGDGFTIEPGGIGAIRHVALSTNSSAASASDTTLASEVTTNGCGRVTAAYAHTFGQSTLTLSNTFTASGTVTGIHKAGAFSCLTSAGADPMWYETVLNVDATLASGDTMALTWTFTLSG